MTEDEKRRQKADLLLEFQEAEHELANLREKAKRFSGKLKALSEWMADCSQPSLADPSYFADRRQQAIQGAEALNLEALKQIDQEISSAQRKVSSLRESKTSLGLN
jgi:hypothetical protein